jgi:hypothetical protein
MKRPVFAQTARSVVLSISETCWDTVLRVARGRVALVPFSFLYELSFRKEALCNTPASAEGLLAYKTRLSLEAYPVSYSIGTWGFLPRDKAAGP